VEERNVAACQEDQVLVGTGDFEGGYWEAYVCGPAVDDYVIDAGHIREQTSSNTMLPDTSIPAPESGGVGEALFVLLFVGALLLVACHKAFTRG
jgi:hypothetical protein